MEASAPSAPHIEPEPRHWMPRSLWVGARLLCGAAAFFFGGMIFAYFYLRLLDVHGDWKIGPVHPSLGLGIAIAVALVASAAILRLASRRPPEAIPLALGALALGLASVVLQVIEWTTLGFGPASGGYASVFIGWTSLYAVLTLGCLYWIETQVASVRRARREGVAFEGEVLSAGLEACSFFWTFYAGLGVLAFIILYVV